MDSRPLQPAGIQEIDRLSRNFNEMAVELDKRTTQLIEVRVAKQAQEREARILARMANTDLLTEVYNRRRIEEILGAELADLTDPDATFGLILCDIDHFKSVNDRHGHLAGDQVLIEMTRLLRAQLRKGDSLGRWGGEEFMIVCPRIDRGGIEQTAEKLRLGIAEHEFPIVGTATASFGATLARPGESMNALVARADSALYAAKESGRNRVHSAE